MKSVNSTDLDVSEETDRKYILEIPWVGNLINSFTAITCYSVSKIYVDSSWQVMC